VSIGWYHRCVLPDGRWRLAPPELVARLDADDEPPGLVLSPRRQVRTMNSTAYGPADPVQVGINPADAAARGVTDGQLVRVTSAHGTVTGHAQVSDRTGRGAVSLTHGRGEVDVSRLTSAVVGIDVLTGMPRMSGVAVTVEPSPAEPPR
jgi:anaerobic selenocysteine-containing dehydrogenase